MNDRELIVSTWKLATTRTPDLLGRTLERLFQRTPSLRRVFEARANRETKDAVVAALASAVTHLHNRRWLETTLRPLGATCARLGIRPEAYSSAADAVIVTVGEACGADWNADVERAFIRAILAITNEMRIGVKAGRVGAAA